MGALIFSMEANTQLLDTAMRVAMAIFFIKIL